MDDKCRICLRTKKNLKNIFHSAKNTCYVDMMQAIARVKIAKDTEIAPNLCCFCCKKLEEAYEFKLEIERADLSINKVSKCKRLHFDSFTKIKFEIDIQADCKRSIEKIKDMTEDFVDGIDEITYCNTLIKKLPTLNASDVCLKPVPVLEFLRTIKDEDGDDFLNADDDGDDISDYFCMDADLVDSEDGDYVPPQKLLKQGKPRHRFNVTKPKNGKKNKNSYQIKHAVCIKPVHLKGLRLIYDYKFKNKSNGDQKTKYAHKPKMCPHCGIMTKSLKSHVLQHTGERTFKCEECGKGFYSLSTLTAHKKTVHATTKNFKCDQCVAAFPNHLALKSHKIMHSSDFKYVCEICSKQFKRRAAHRRHTRSHNVANKSVMCELCNMSFFTPHMLRHHMRVHTGERPFNCEICSQPYSYKHDFNRHCLKKHGVFLKRRNVRVMNEEVLEREKQLLRDLALRMHGVARDDQPLNPFEHEGPGAAMAFHLVMKAIEAKQIPIDVHL